MKVVVDARIAAGGMGGVEQVARGLAQGFADLVPPAEVTFLTTAHDGWLRDVVGPHQIVHARRSTRSPAAAADAVRRRLADRVPSMRGLPIVGAPVPLGSAVVPGPRPDVVHFVTQQGFRTRAPSLYNPHDLLHLHHPEFFPPAEVRRRELVYRALCRQASLVVAMTSWTRDDLVNRYGLPPEKVRVIPWGAPMGVAAGTVATEVRNRYQLPDRFALYPAHTWPHKNHVRLLEAIEFLGKSHGLTVPLVCTGQEDSYAGTIREAIDRLQVGRQVHLLGRIPHSDLAALYGLAHCVVFPSLFEGWGLPVFEAFASGVPVACSTATSLPEQTRGAAMLFDPLDIVDIAEAVAEVWENRSVRQRLESAGRDRVRTLTWRRTAIAYRALYREVAARPLDELDRRIVAATFDSSVEEIPLPPDVGEVLPA